MEWVVVSHNIFVSGFGDIQNNEEMWMNVVGMVESSGEAGVEHQGTSVEKIGMMMAVWHGMVVQAGVWKRVKGWLDTRVD